MSLLGRILGRKKSSPEMSALAGNILGSGPMPEGEMVSAAVYNTLLKRAKRLAGSVLSQDEERG